MRSRLRTFLALSLLLAFPAFWPAPRPPAREMQSMSTGQPVDWTALADAKSAREAWYRALPSAAATPPAPHPRQRSGTVQAAATGAYSSLQPCGGDLPPCWVKQRESHGNYSAYNPTGCGGRGCGGAWQFDPRTWAGYGGYAEAQDAPPDVQDAKAREVWAGGAGCSHWAAC